MSLTRQLSLPAGVHRQSGAMLSLAECCSNPSAVADLSTLNTDQKLSLVSARWLAGEWSDIIYNHQGFFDRDRALAELRAGSDIGKHLMAIELRAIEMAREDAVVREAR